MTATDASTGYLAAEGYEEQLAAELGGYHERFGRLFLAPGPPRPVAWAVNTWFEPQRLTVESIGKGAKALRAIQRNWALYAHDHHRRAALLAAKLPHVSARPLTFPAPAPAAPLGSWTLLDRDTVLAARRCSSPFPNGEARFVEDRDAPPNRAYLKLYEALTRLGTHPRPGDTCLDLGSSPGGWTWVLAELGARVISVDKAPLDPAIANRQGVTHRQESAFGIEPFAVDWLFCDVACYPERLLGLVERWLPFCSRMVCTIKFQGATDHEVTARFGAIEGAEVRHLHHNKHEVTFFRVP